MKRTVTYLRVTIDEDDEQDVSALRVFENKATGQKIYELALRPKGDAKHLPVSSKNIGTVIAHELGHFVSFLSKMPSHSFDDEKLDGKAAVSVEAEQDAWSFAHIMEPNLDPEIEKEALESYKSRRRLETWRMINSLNERK